MTLNWFSYLSVHCHVYLLSFINFGIEMPCMHNYATTHTFSVRGSYSYHCGYYVMQDCSRDISDRRDRSDSQIAYKRSMNLITRIYFMSATYPVLGLQLSVAKILQNPV